MPLFSTKIEGVFSVYDIEDGAFWRFLSGDLMKRGM